MQDFHMCGALVHSKQLQYRYTTRNIQLKYTRLAYVWCTCVYTQLKYTGLSYINIQQDFHIHNLWVTNCVCESLTMYTNHTWTAYMSHNLLFWVTNYAYGSRTMCMSHKLCMWDTCVYTQLEYTGLSYINIQLQYTKLSYTWCTCVCTTQIYNLNIQDFHI